MVLVHSRTYLSIQHLLSSAKFTKLTYEIEYGDFPNDNEERQKIFIEQKTFAIGAIFSVIAFVEANINEFFQDAYEFPSGNIKNLKCEVSKKRLANIWRIGALQSNSFSILDKYNMALAICDREIFQNGENILDNIRNVIDLRNTLVHYHPETINVTNPYDNKDAVVLRKLQRRLGKKFKLNPLLPNNPFFPDRVLSHGCAEWCLISCLDLVNNFYDRLEMPIPYEHIKKSLDTR